MCFFLQSRFLAFTFSGTHVFWQSRTQPRIKSGHDHYQFFTKPPTSTMSTSAKEAKHTIQQFQDSYYIPEYLHNHKEYFDWMNAVVNWNDRRNPALNFRGRPLPRTKAFWSLPLTHTQEYPIYTYPGFQYGSLGLYVDLREEADPSARLINQLRLKLQGTDVVDLTVTPPLVIPHAPEINHVIGTLYRDGSDNIKPHSDKMTHLDPTAPIYILSFGAARDLVFTDKQGVFQCRFTLAPGSLFILGPETNRMFEHSIPKIHHCEPRISLIFRKSITYVSRATIAKNIARTWKQREQRKQHQAPTGIRQKLRKLKGG